MSKIQDPFKNIKNSIKKIISGKYVINLKPLGKNKDYDELAELLNTMSLKINNEMGSIEQNRKCFEEFVNMLPLTVFETDDRGNLVFVNQTAYKTFGYTRKDFKNGMNALEMLVPEDRKKAAENMQKRASGVINKSHEYTALTKKGKTFPILLDSVRLKKDDNFIGFRGFLIDISEMKKVQLELQKSRNEMREGIIDRTSELQTAIHLLENKIKEEEKSKEALKESEERYRSLFERSFDGIYIHDFQGNFLDANNIAMKMVGYKKSDILKLNFASLLTEDQFPRTLQDLQELKDTGTQKEVSNYKIRKKDGSFIWIETKSSVIYKNDEPYAIQGVVRDITKRMRTEKELAESINYVENILMSMADSLFVIDEEAKIKTVNYSMLDLLGFEIEELLGNHVSIILEKDFYDKKNNEKFQGFFKELIDKDFIRNHEMYFKNIHGEIIPVNISGSVMYDETKKMIGVVCIAHDMRDVRNATAQLIQSEKLAALGQLVAGLAHELNQPLNNIMIIAQSLNRDLERGRFDKDELGNDLDEIVDHVNKMSSIISHTRNFSRDSEKEKMDFLDLNEVVKNSLKFINAQLKVHNFNVILNLMENLPEIKLNPIQIEQVLLNFITNARFSVEKSEKQERKIEIKTFQNEGLVVIEIIDNGVGIPKKVLSKIFQPFFTTKEKGEGTGLGLSVAKGIIENHRGKIEVESEPGQGATFRIIFPISAK